MNVYEWLESPDVREYLEGIHYEFTLPEAFYVIRENEQRALEEKIAAWEELLNVMPDCPFSIESDAGGKVETASFTSPFESLSGSRENCWKLFAGKMKQGYTASYWVGFIKKGKGLRFRNF